jgi:hypothetical protein
MKKPDTAEITGTESGPTPADHSERPGVLKKIVAIFICSSSYSP